jgi:hypothetical protein
MSHKRSGPSPSVLMTSPSLTVALIAGVAVALASCQPTSVVFPTSRMEQQLSLAKSERRARLATDSALPTSVLTALYPDVDIDTLYFSVGPGALEAFRFQINSAMVGVAYVHRDSGVVTRIELYNVFDQRLFNAFAPSYTVYLFHANDTNYIFDGLGRKLYMGYPKPLVSIQPALFQYIQR